MSDFQIPTDIQQAGTNAANLISGAGQVAAEGATISDALKKAITNAYSENKDIVGPLDTAQGEYLNSPNVARNKYQNIFNPFAREELVGKYVQNTALPMLSLSNMYGNRMGRIDDLLNAGINTWKALQGSWEAKANAATKLYENKLNEYKTSQTLKQNERQMDIDWYKATHPAGGGGDATNSTIAIWIEEARTGKDIDGDGFIAGRYPVAKPGGTWNLLGPEQQKAVNNTLDKYTNPVWEQKTQPKSGPLDKYIFKP